MAERARRPGWRLAATVPVLAIALAARGRIAATLRGGTAGEWIALATLLFLLAVIWWPVVRRGARDESAREARDPIWVAFRRHRPAMVGLALVALLSATALLTPYLAPHDPATQGADIVATRYQPPSIDHPMGTDRFGRDVLSRVLYGGRTSLGIGVLAMLIALTLGTAVGAAAGYWRGWVDAVAMRIVDALLSFPRLILLIAIVALWNPSVWLITLVLGLTGWMGTSRIVRGEVLSIREREFVTAARALGYGAARILGRHVLPNAIGAIVVAATLGIGNTILAEAALSFLGLGVPPPAPSWGGMVNEGRQAMIDAWWISAFPGLAIVFTVMAFNLIGDGLRDALDPRSTAGRS